jgi:ubiquitin carboxyl-terminal hydrolase 5/13
MEVPLSACLQDMLAPRLLLRSGETVRDLSEAAAASSDAAVVSFVQSRFKTFPRYLMLKLQRYFVDREWKQRKIDISVPMPEHLDLSAYLSGGLQPGEVEMEMPPSSAGEPSQAAGASAGADLAAREAMEAEVAVQLMSMGFEEIMCRRAARAVSPGGDAEAAMNWLLEHMDDADIRDPLPPLGAPAPAVAGGSSAPAAPSFDEEAVAMLMSLGYSAARVSRALRETGGDTERAADWLFSHLEGEGDEVCVCAFSFMFMWSMQCVLSVSFLSLHRWKSMRPPPQLLRGMAPPPLLLEGIGCWRSYLTWAEAPTTGTMCVTSAGGSSGSSSMMTS